LTRISLACRELSDWQQEVVISATVFGAMLSSLASGPLCDRLGRRLMVLAAGVMFVAGALVMALAPDYVVLMLGRFVIGLGVGSASMNMPIIISEMAEAQVRGMLVTCINVAITFGQFAACLVAGGLSTTEGGWRVMLGLAAVPAAVQFVGFLYMPESPRHLVQTGRVVEALAVLVQIRGEGTAREAVVAELDEIVDAVARDGQGADTSFWEHMSSPHTRRALLLGCLLQCAQQIGGINTIMYYSATILKLSGFTSNTQVIWLSAVVAFCNFFGSCVALRLVERLGRRVLMLGSQAAVTVMLLALATTFYMAQTTSTRLHDEVYDLPYGVPSSHCSSYKYCFDCVQDEGCGFCSQVAVVGGGVYTDVCLSNNDDNDTPSNTSLCSGLDYEASSCPGSATTGWLIFLFLCLYLFAFSPGMGPMPWCINSEIYSNSFRSTGSSLATAANWGSNILMSATFLTLIDLFSKQGVFVAYAVVTAAFLCFFFKFLPETKNLPLEDITHAFDDENWGQRVYFESSAGGGGNSGDSDGSGDSLLEHSAVNEALLKTKYFEESSTASSRRHSDYSGRTSGDYSGLLAGEISYSTQNEDTGRPSIVEC